jgi:cytochrome c
MRLLATLPVLLSIGGMAMAGDCDTGPGQKAFANKCGICHVAETGATPTVGPNLHRIVGRDIGKASGFPYSEALANATGQWTESGLNEFLASPQTVFPGNAMPFEGLKSDAERQKLICYLSSLN